VLVTVASTGAPDVALATVQTLLYTTITPKV
jgi:hypothetical protein